MGLGRAPGIPSDAVLRELRARARVAGRPAGGGGLGLETAARPPLQRLNLPELRQEGDLVPGVPLALLRGPGRGAGDGSPRHVSEVSVWENGHTPEL